MSTFSQVISWSLFSWARELFSYFPCQFTYLPQAKSLVVAQSQSKVKINTYDNLVMF